MIEQEHSSRLGRLNRAWYAPDIVLIGLLFAYITYVHSHCLTSYRGGLHNTMRPFIRTVALLVVFTPMAGLSLLVVVIRLGVSWPKHIPDRRRLWRLRLLVIGGLVAYSALFFMPVPWVYDSFTAGLKKYAQTHVDLPAIRAWLTTLDPEDCTGERLPVEYLMETEKPNWPEAITSLNPRQMCLCLDSGNRPVVRVIWGRLDHDWGLVVGPEDTAVLRTEPRQGMPRAHEHVFYDRAMYHLPLVPGACVWHEVY